MPRYDIVFLDADNTLFDFDAAEHAALRLVLEERGYPATPETEALYLGFNRDLWSAFDRGEVTQEFLLVERFRLLTRALGGTDDPAAFNRDYLSHMAACSRLLPGAEALCRDLVRRVPAGAGHQRGGPGPAHPAGGFPALSLAGGGIHLGGTGRAEAPEGLF